MKNKVSIIIPFLNEEENISFLTERLNDFCAAQQEFAVEVVFVNDGSTDNSLQLLKTAVHEHYACKIVSLSKNFGSHSALRAGIQKSTGDYLCFMYADLQDPLSLIGYLYKKCLEGNDVCWATREATRSSWMDKAFSRAYCFLMRKYVFPDYPVHGFDIVMFNRKIQAALNQNMENNSSLFIQILLLGFKQTNIYYKKDVRKKGKSKWTLSKKIKLVIDSFVAFSYAPIRFVTITGILLFFIGLIWTAYLVIRKLVYNDLESGWPALMSVLLMGFGITNISLGILAEYLWRNFDATRKRPVFIIDEVIELPAQNVKPQ